MNTLKSALLTLFSALFLAVVVISLWAYADDNFRNSLFSRLDTSLLEPLIKKSTPYNDIRKKLADEGSLNEILNTELDQKQTELDQLRSTIDKLKADTQSAISQSEETEKALKIAREKQESAFDDLSKILGKEKNSHEIAISQLKNSMTVIRIGNKVLFSSGSAHIKNSGKNVLRLISKTLNEFPDRQIRVDGHTDNQPVLNPATKSKYDSNWELSTARAVAAVRLLEETGKVDAKRLLAAGFGEHHPVASNADNTGRAANRRIEIVLLPESESYIEEQL